MEKITRDQLIAKLSKMDGTSEIVDALLDWFETPTCEADWVTKDGSAGIIEKVAMGDMPKTILSDWTLYSEWAKARTVSREWVLCMVCTAIDMRICIQGSPKRWAKDIYDVNSGRYSDDRIANPLMTWCNRMYDFVMVPELRKRAVNPDVSMAEKNAIADRLRNCRDYGEAIVECVLGYRVNLTKWCNCDGVGMVPVDCYERVKQVYDINAVAEKQQREYHEDEYVHQHKLELERKYQAKKKIANNWIG